MQPSKTKKEWEQEFKTIYIDILKKSHSYDELITLNENGLNQFKSEYTIDNNSIEFLPAYFNFIECFLAQSEKLGEVKKYLIVGLTNLLNASKKLSTKNYQDRSVLDMDPAEINTKLLQSRLDLLFGRYNLIMRAPGSETIDKLTSSIITYSEIYGPENVGLTPQYYYLAEYFLDYSNNDGSEKIIAKKIYMKIADMWRFYFNGMINPLFHKNYDDELILAVGETFVKMIGNKISHVFPRDSENELDLKFKILKVIILKRTNSDFYAQALNSVLENQNKIESKLIDKDWFKEMNEQMSLDE